MQAPSAIISRAWYLRFGAFHLPSKAVKGVLAEIASQVTIRDRVSNVAQPDIGFSHTWPLALKRVAFIARPFAVSGEWRSRFTANQYSGFSSSTNKSFAFY